MKSNLPVPVSTTEPVPVVQGELVEPATVEAPDYVGHRSRQREKFIRSGGDVWPDHEFLELVLFRSIPRRDVKPLAWALIKRFGSFAQVINAEPARLAEIAGIGPATILDLRMIASATRRVAFGEIEPRSLIESWKALITYLRASMAFLPVEEFRVIFLDKRNYLLADEVQGRGTIDHTPAYPREIARRAIELSATAVILVHNHPSGDPKPSAADIRMTRDIISALDPLGITIHDHVILGREGHTSFRGQKLI